MGLAFCLLSLGCLQLLIFSPKALGIFRLSPGASQDGELKPVQCSRHNTGKQGTHAQGVSKTYSFQGVDTTTANIFLL